jgi:hypothetical protein
MLSISDFNRIFSEIRKTSEKLDDRPDHDQLKISISISAVQQEAKAPKNETKAKTQKPVNPVTSTRQRKKHPFTPRSATKDKSVSQRKIWTEHDYLRLLHGSYRGLSRPALAIILDRCPAKIFSKLQKHMNMITSV